MYAIIESHGLSRDPLLQETKNNVSATVGPRRALLHAISPVLGSRAEPNLIHIQCVAAPSGPSIRPIRSSPVINRSNRALKMLIDISLHVWIGEIIAHVLFLVVTNVAVDCISGTTFLDHHVKAILPPQRKVLFFHAPSVALTRKTPSTHDKKTAWRSTLQQLPQTQGQPKRSARRLLRIHRHGKLAWSKE